MPLEILRSELPLVTFWNLIADGEGKKVGGRAIGETNDHGEEDPIAKRGKLVCDLPAGGVIGGGDIVKDSIRLSKEICQGLVIKGRRSYSKDTVAIPA